MEKKPVFSKKEQDQHSEYPVNTWEKVLIEGEIQGIYTVFYIVTAIATVVWSQKRNTNHQF